ncbi:MAG: ribose 5-phosphate isomerase B [Bacteroidales bacterium]
MIIGIANDHAGYNVKLQLIKYIESLGYSWIDFGCHSDQSCDYPDYAHPLAQAVEQGEVDLGISICGTGNGINMAVNKHTGIRSALCWNEEIAELARKHNDANICALPARFISPEMVVSIVNRFLTTPFEGGRHLRRIQKIPCS